MASTTIPSPWPSPDTLGAPLSDELPLELFDDDAEIPQALLVRVAGERLAIPLSSIRAVMRGRRTVRLPGAPAWVAGLAAVRGALLPVAILSARASGVPNGMAPDWLVLADHGSRSALLAVDAVDGVHVITPDDESVDAMTDATLPGPHAVRLLSQGAANADGAIITADVLDVDAVFRELFEED